jgi:small subunit ribosomal protein S19
MPRLIDTDSAMKKKSEQNVVVTYLRAATIGPSNINKTVHVHNGHKFVPLRLTERMVGYKFGQFALTKKRVHHKKKKRNK